MDIILDQISYHSQGLIRSENYQDAELHMLPGSDSRHLI
jgi:hypothetical protein